MSIVPHTRPSAGLDTLSDRHRWILLLGEASQLAHHIANTNFVPKGLRGDEAAITAAILYGDEVGLPPMQALAKIAVIDGKPALSAEAQRALILAAGHRIWGEGTSSKYTWSGQRADTGDTMAFTWTLDDARKAKLANKINWQLYPRAMLSARASADLARGLFADVIGGLAATEELEDTPPPEPDTEPKAGTQRRRRPAPIIAPASPEPAEPNPPPLPDELPAPQPALPDVPADDPAGPAALGQLDITETEGDQVSADSLEILAWMRREANVDDLWLRMQLLELGLEDLPEQITKGTMRRLTKAQANRLKAALSDEIDQRNQSD